VLSYPLRRVLLLLPTVFGVSLLAFGVAHASPGDPAVERFRRVEGRSPTSEEAAAARRELHLDDPLLRQYGRWVDGAVHGDLGRSFTTGLGVSDELRRGLPATAELTLAASLLALLVAVPSGVFAAVHHNRLIDHVLRLGSLGLASMPSFWLALVLIDLVAVRLSLAPVAGRQGLGSLVLPAVAVAAAPAAVLARFTRAAVLETLGEDHVRTGRAKGLAETRVLFRHALRPSLAPLVTAFGSSLGALLVGSVIVETIFVWPGIGQLSITAIFNRDYPMIQGVVLYAGVTFAVVNLLVDLSYSLVDPRIRLGRAATA
jgi:ABC-type dipeptide/oligopeptide/nickel transport system permease component